MYIQIEYWLVVVYLQRKSIFVLFSANLTNMIIFFVLSSNISLLALIDRIIISINPNSIKIRITSLFNYFPNKSESKTNKTIFKNCKTINNHSTHEELDSQIQFVQLVPCQIFTNKSTHHKVYPQMRLDLSSTFSMAGVFLLFCDWTMITITTAKRAIATPDRT